MTQDPKPDRCSGGGGVKVSLPVLREGGSTQAKPHSRMGKWRAVVLITVHLLIVAHIVQWLITGSTVSPVEPSESMKTLEMGDINAGFIFFVLAILATLVFGRYFCGWGCHVVALQDLCTWLMNKIGVRPKPFRSRLLVWAPLAFGLYMFVWPTFKRVALFPALAAMDIEKPVWLRSVADFHGLGSELIVSDFWATFPPWYVAIPFFLVIGFAAVYFLGSKGFCTYGCPYGGIFGVVDRVSPGRIVVNDDCHQCGHCTAVCTSNVRVHEEIRDFGMVVNPGCMKCMDCVSACPNDALSFSFAKPAAWLKPKDNEAKARQAKIRKNPKRFDLNWVEEIVLATVFVGMFLAYRGMLNLVPMLMAGGMAGIGTFIVWKGWTLLVRPNVRVQSLVLKSKGKIRALGALSALVALAVLLSAVWSGSVAALRYGGRLDHERIDVPASVVLRPEYVAAPSTKLTAQRGLDRFERSTRIGWSLNAEQKREQAYLALVADDRAKAEKLLAEIIQDGRPTEELVRQQLALMSLRGAESDEILETLQVALSQHPGLTGLAPDIALRLASSDGGSLERADSFWDDLLDSQPESIVIRLQAAEYFIASGRMERARALLPESIGTGDFDASIVGVRVLLKLGERERARELLAELSDGKLPNLAAVRVMASLWISMGEIDRAKPLVQLFLDENPKLPGAFELRAKVALTSGDFQTATGSFRSAIELAGTNPWVLLSLGESVTIAGLQTGNTELRDIGLGALRRASELAPASPLIQHDYGKALIASGEIEEGLGFLERASDLAPDSQAIGSTLETARQTLGRR